jgi:hypothetical protein
MMRWNSDPSLTAHRHASDTNVPAFDYLASSEFEPERFPFFVCFLCEDLSAPVPLADGLTVGLFDEIGI